VNSLYEETEIPRVAIAGPLDLEATLLSGQTSEPQWDLEDGYYSDVEDFEGRAARYRVRQSGTREEPLLKIKITSDAQDASLAKIVTDHIVNVLRLHDDLNAFYRAFDSAKGDIVSKTFPQLIGLRLMRGNNMFESLISSISTQHNSIVLWTKSVKAIRETYGPVAHLSDGSTIHLFPKPEALASASERDIEKTGLTYRAKYIIEAARRVRDGELKLEELQRDDYEKAKTSLMELPGIGPKVADCFLLYGLGKTEAAPVDIWIHRIVRKLYFHGASVSTEKVARFLRERYGSWAGYVQLYLFHYARKTRLV
jgi:N-glycosylase/DNA lyase